MTCEKSREEDLAMMNIDFGPTDKDPLNTTFLLPFLGEKKRCARFYGKN